MYAVHNQFFPRVLDVIAVNTGYSTEFALGLAIIVVIVGLVFQRIGLPTEKATGREKATLALAY